MTKTMSVLPQLLLSWLLCSSHGDAFTHSSLQQRRFIASSSLSNLHSTKPPLRDDEVADIRLEIEEMRREALRRMEALETKLHEADVNAEERKRQKVKEMATASAAVKETTATASAVKTLEEEQPSMAVSGIEPASAETTESPAIRLPTRVTAPTDSHADRRLHRTWWKLMLNVGREPGTWMPKSWGASGERLLLNLELEFTSDQLFAREEFLNGMGGAKILRVHDLYLGPTLTEDSHQVKVKDTGGWRVASGEGPMGTDLLRFYIELEEESRHQGGDVYCPKGRVYMTCGFFPTYKDGMSTGLKDQLQKDQRMLTTRYEQVSLDMEDANLWDKIKLGKELMDLRMQSDKVASQLNEVKVREPEKTHLRFAPRGDVALTKEGGLCCRVSKGLAVEYHILGKFGVAAAPHHDELAKGTGAVGDGGLRP